MFDCTKIFLVHKIDYIKTFALILYWEFLRIFLAFITAWELKIKQINVVGVYLENLLSEIDNLIYIKVSQGLKSKRIELIFCILQSFY